MHFPYVLYGYTGVAPMTKKAHTQKATTLKSNKMSKVKLLQLARC